MHARSGNSNSAAYSGHRKRTSVPLASSLPPAQPPSSRTPRRPPVCEAIPPCLRNGRDAIHGLQLKNMENIFLNLSSATATALQRASAPQCQLLSRSPRTSPASTRPLMVTGAKKSARSPSRRAVLQPVHEARAALPELAGAAGRFGRRIHLPEGSHPPRRSAVHSTKRFPQVQ